MHQRQKNRESRRSITDTNVRQMEMGGSKPPSKGQKFVSGSSQRVPSMVIFILVLMGVIFFITSTSGSNGGSVAPQIPSRSPHDSTIDSASGTIGEASHETVIRTRPTSDKVSGSDDPLNSPPTTKPTPLAGVGFGAETIRNVVIEGLHKAEGFLRSNEEAKTLPIPVTSEEFNPDKRDVRFDWIGQRGMTIWITHKLSDSKINEFLDKLESRLLKDLRLHVYRLELGHLNNGLLRDEPFASNQEMARRAAELCAVMSDAGMIVIANIPVKLQATRDWIKRSHGVRGLKFMEIYIKTSDLNSVTDTKSIEATFEEPISPELIMNADKTDQSVETVVSSLLSEGVAAGRDVPNWYPLQAAFDGGFGYETPKYSTYSRAAAAKFPKVLLSDLDLQWVQCIGEGWAAPLNGFMREGTLLQTLHFNSILSDPYGLYGNDGLHSSQTNFDSFPNNLQKGIRVSMPIPIILPINSRTKLALGSSSSISLVSPVGKIVAVLTNPEIYEFRKEELISRVWGGWDDDHPYISRLMRAGDYLLGGEIELLDRIRYKDGLDKYRLTPKELRDIFKEKNADAVYAFQTRNPTHAGHAHLMQEAGERLEKQGFRKPMLWLSPLGGWSKSDDVPLDVRVKQHVAVIDAGMLPASTVLAIWPSPMIYAGPTEVQWHAKSRRNAGAKFFITGRDPAGIKRSKSAGGGDFYKGEHGRYVLQNSPGLGDMQILSFGKVYYDKTDSKMKARDSSRKSDFLSISGSKMRAMAGKGVIECGSIPEDWEDTLSCVPPGFMVPEGWKIMTEYYQNPTDIKWVPYSRPLGSPLLPSESNLKEKGVFGKLEWKLHFEDRGGNEISPWHDIPLGLASKEATVNMLVVNPMGKMEELEIKKTEKFNPFGHVADGKLAKFTTYGIPFFNKGFLPQTWRDPESRDSAGSYGDGDPIEIVEIGGKPLGTGSVVSAKIIGLLNMTDSGSKKVKYTVITVAYDDSDFIADAESLEEKRPGLLSSVIEWMSNSQGYQSVKVNEILVDTARTIQVIQDSHGSWNKLATGKAYGEGYKLSGGFASEPVKPPAEPKMEEDTSKEETSTEVEKSVVTETKADSVSDEETKIKSDALPPINENLTKNENAIEKETPKETKTVHAAESISTSIEETIEEIEKELSPKEEGTSKVESKVEGKSVDIVSGIEKSIEELSSEIEDVSAEIEKEEIKSDEIETEGKSIVAKKLVPDESILEESGKTTELGEETETDKESVDAQKDMLNVKDNESVVKALSKINKELGDIETTKLHEEISEAGEVAAGED
mmetsp:Transcript_13952/g.21097  ORF Transcript_13952/g.21097 Transcript_13952/m.21097 type:complete len:1286 (-) Transcript_13952:194-4051(-)